MCVCVSVCVCVCARACVCGCVCTWQNELLEHSVRSLTDELQDISSERSVFQEKAHRLNLEMNQILGNDHIRLLDVDALCMENRWVCCSHRPLKAPPDRPVLHICTSVGQRL